MKRLFLVLMGLVFTHFANASDFGFNDLSQGDVDDIFKEFSATFTHSTVTGAKSHSKIFGFEAGLVAGVTKSDAVKDLVADSMPSGSEDINYLPFASLYALVSLPMGITAEANFMPELDIRDVEFKHLSLAGKFEITYFVDLPVDLAVRAMLIDTSISVKQSSSSTGNFNGEIEYDQTQLGLQGIISKRYAILEPYFSVGFMRSSGDLTANGTGTIFNSSFSGSKKVDSSASGLQIAAGLQVNLLLVKVGAEYVNAFGANHLNAKLALSF